MLTFLVCLHSGESMTAGYSHGVGVRYTGIARLQDISAVRLTKRLKRSVDPQGIMNPGKLGLGDGNMDRRRSSRSLSTL